ncbi:hypothetical protein DB346_21410 [Verrucomicrobia bacterium LW23]|nr:hypothetical protein DB346_21410 [Verrucomicrobia bacterium LW23]
MTPLPPFLIDNITAVRAKIRNFEGNWKRRWEHFLSLARAEKRSVRWYGPGTAGDMPLHAAFALLIDGPQWADAARRDVMWMLDNYEATLQVGAQDLDTWIYAATMVRRAIACDWLWDSGVFSEEEKARLADHFITDSLKYPYVVLHHRVPPHANNQGLAQALNLVTIGYLFGVRRGNDPRARHLLEVGLPHMHQQTAYLPPDGYSGEGSTYIVAVADPLMALGTAVMEAITREDYLNLEFAPSANSALKVLELNARLVPPSGVLPAWDQHGFQLPKAGTTACYLAHRTGDPSYAYHYLFGEGWEFAGHFAWMADDHVWMLIWMPDPSQVAPPASGAKCYPRSWAVDRVGGALLNKMSTLHLFQMWDLASSRPIRAHMNPNALLLEAWGSLLTVDGNAVEDVYELNGDPRMQYLHQYFKEPRVLSWAAGSLGAHSCIVVDGAIEHTNSGGGFRNVPEEVVTGTLQRLESLDELQVLAADVAPFYANRFDIQSMVRSSALVDDRLWVILDSIAAETSHEFTWQLVLRWGASLTEYGARLTTAEHVVLDVISVDSARFSMHDVPGYPNTLEARCHWLQKSLRGHAVEFVTILVPQLARHEVADWTSGWRKRAILRGECADSIAVPSREEANGGEWRDGELCDCYFEAPTREKSSSGGQMWFCRSCEVPASAGGADRDYLLELPRTSGLYAWVDGIAVPIPEMSPYHGESTRLMAPFVDVTALVRGKSEVHVAIMFPQRGRVSGSVKLHIARNVAPPSVTRQGDRIDVTVGSHTHSIDLRKIRTSPKSDAAFATRGADPMSLAEEMLRKVLSPLAETEAPHWNGSAEQRGRACALAMHAPLSDVEQKLIATAMGDADWGVRLLAIFALGRHKSQRAVPILCEILREESVQKIKADDYPPKYRLKEAALVALGRIGDASAVPEICSVLAPEDFYGARRIAADILGLLGDPFALPTLKKWVNDSDWETACAARRSIDLLTPQAEMPEEVPVGASAS